MVNYNKAVELINEYDFKKEKIIINSYDALGHVLAADVISKVDVPSFNKSAMDGYAIRDKTEIVKQLTVIDTLYAGSNKNPKLKPGECVKIMTGAPVPDDANYIVIQEVAIEQNNLVTFKNDLGNNNIILIGEDIKANKIIFKQGEYITASKVTSLVSCGVFEVYVYKKPRILLITTGDEIQLDGVRLEYGQIYNSNKALIKSRLIELGFTCDCMHICDEIDDFSNTSISNYDLVITTGGISVGEKDVIRNYIKRHNTTVIFDRVNIMPGGPCAFWVYNNIPIISLAGSPFANFVTFELFARRILAHLVNDEFLINQEQEITFKGQYSKDIKKRRFIKAKMTNEYVYLPTNNNFASSMHEMNNCNSLICLTRGNINLTTGDLVTVIDLRRNYE